MAKNNCAVLGHPISHSLSPLMFNAAFTSQAMNWEYRAVDLQESDISAFFATVRNGNKWRGFSVTMPLKKIIVQMADEISDRVTILGVANTLYLRNNKWYADNTDVAGLTAAIDSCSVQSFSHAVIAGAGGTARAALGALAQYTTEVKLLVRTIETAQTLLGVAQKLALNLEIIDINSPQATIACKDAPLSISTLPIGVPDKYYDDLSLSARVIDVLYSPWPTPLVERARSRGAWVQGGLNLLLYQAFAQYQLFTKTPAPREVMADALYCKTGIKIAC